MQHTRKSRSCSRDGTPTYPHTHSPALAPNPLACALPKLADTWKLARRSFLLAYQAVYYTRAVVPRPPAGPCGRARRRHALTEALNLLTHVCGSVLAVPPSARCLSSLDDTEERALRSAQGVVARLRRRQLYRFTNQFTVPPEALSDGRWEVRHHSDTCVRQARMRTCTAGTGMGDGSQTRQPTASVASAWAAMQPHTCLLRTLHLMHMKRARLAQRQFM